MSFIEFQIIGKEFIHVDALAAPLSGVLTQFMQVQSRNDGPNNGKKFLVNYLNPTVLRMVVEWLEHHKNNTLYQYKDFKQNKNVETFHDGKKRAILSEWDKNFFLKHCKFICNLMSAAEVLQIHGLYEQSAQVIADYLSKKTPDEIRCTFKNSNKKNILDPYRTFSGGRERIRNPFNRNFCLCRI